MTAIRHAEFDAGGDFVNAILMAPEFDYHLEAGHVLIAHEEACEGWRYESGELVPPEPVPAPAPEPQPAQPSLYAVALLTIADGEVSGVDVASRFSGAFWLDVGLYIVFFAETLPDTSYLAKAYDAAATVRVVEKAVDYIVVSAADAAGDPVDPAEISIEIIRVS